MSVASLSKWGWLKSYGRVVWADVGRVCASMILRTVSVFALCSWSSTGIGQQFPPGTFSIDGFPVHCGNAVTIVSPAIPGIAEALPGRIFLHPILSTYPTGVKLFVYAHECAHQFVGANEVAADAWAIRLGKAQGWLTPLVLDQVCQSVWFSSGTWAHFPGPQRCQLMIELYYGP